MLHAKHGKQISEVDELGLELNDQQGPGSWVPAKEVDDASLSVLRERNLRSHDPARERADPTDDELRERSVSSIHGSIDIDRSGAREDFYPDLEHGRNPSGEVEWLLAETPALDARHGGARDTGSVGDVLLAPAASDPRESDQPSEADVIHVHGGSAAAVIAGLSRDYHLARVFDILR